MKKNSVISIIIIVLILLTAILFFRGCSQEESEMKNYSVAGTYTETTTYKNAEITVSGVNIDNATYTGNVTITDSVVNGDIRLTNSNVQGDLTVKGGNTIYLDGGSYQSVTVEKTGAKIILLGEAKIETLKSTAACSVSVNNQSKLKNMIVDKTASRTAIATQDSGSIDFIQSKGISDIVLNTPTKSIAFGPNATGSTLVANAIVDKIQTEAKVALTLNANVGSLIITGTGDGTSVILGNNAVITSMGTDARVEISGEGSVTSATTNDPLNITGTITPEVVYITTKPVITDPNGGLMISTNTSRTSTSGSGGSGSTTLYAESGDSCSLINSKYNLSPLDPPSTNICVTGIQVTPIEADVIMGNTLTLNAIIFPENASNQTISWESSDSNIATVCDGVVTPVSNGEVTITARTQDGDKTDSCIVTVKTNLTAVTMINTIAATNNTIAETIQYNGIYTLPVVVIVQGYGNEKLPCPVNWVPNPADIKKVGETAYTGTLTLPAGYVNLNDIQPKILLTVQAQPLITNNSILTSQRIYLNGDPAPLTVDAIVTEGKLLTYQWSQRIGDIDTPLPDVTGPTYDPPVSTKPGTTYYYCVVSTDNTEPVSLLVGIVVTSSAPATPLPPTDPDVSVVPAKADTPADPAVSADPVPVVSTDPVTLSEMPNIIVQPTSISQGTGVALAALAQDTSTAQATIGAAIPARISFSADASVSDGGTLTYQWFESASAINADGTMIPAATDKTLTLNAADISGPKHYYVEITNTKAGCLPVTAVSLPVSVTII